MNHIIFAVSILGYLKKDIDGINDCFYEWSFFFFEKNDMNHFFFIVNYDWTSLPTIKMVTEETSLLRTSIWDIRICS